MSCSDKILRSNVLGLQGAHLSLLIHPIYLDKIIMGSRFDHGICVRAFCCRVEEETFRPDQMHHFKVNHPMINRVTDYMVSPDTKLKTCKVAANWSLEGPLVDGKKKLVEILDPQHGKAFSWSPFKSQPNAENPPSRLCKAASFFRFKQILGSEAKKEVDLLTYREVKLLAKSFNDMKDAFRQNLVDNNFGSWVNKPREFLENFYK